MNFNFFMPANVLSGRGVLLKSGAKMASYGKKCGILTGPSSAVKSGAFGDAVKVLEENGISYCVFNEIKENPLISDCKRAGDFFRENGVEFILGIGGGSALDAAKAVAIYAANESLEAGDIYLRKYDNEPLPVCLIGTTTGTGSEVTGVSVLTHHETGRKKSISGPDCYAKLVFADPQYTKSMPYKVAVSTCLDALSHAIEGYFTPKCGEIQTMFAEKAIPMIYDCIQTLEEYELFGLMPEEADINFYDKAYYGSLYAGITLNTCGTAFPHPLGYVLTENYGIPHGKACTCFMTELIERGRIYENKKYLRLFEILGTDEKTFCNKIEKATDVKIKMSREDIAKYCSRWDEAVPGNFLQSPGSLTKEEAQEIFEKKFL